MLLASVLVDVTESLCVVCLEEVLDGGVVVVKVDGDGDGDATGVDVVDGEVTGVDELVDEIPVVDELISG